MTNICETSSTTESASTTDALFEFLYDNHIRGIDPLNDELRNAVTLLDREVGVAEVEEDDLDLASVVGINDTSTGVNAMLGGET